MSNAALTTDSNERKGLPIMRGFLDYFPAAAAEVARLSREGNEKHNPGEEMHHARGKSSDHADCIVRHLIDRGTVDTDGFLHDVKVAWRAMAMLQEKLEELGAPLARGARLPEPTLTERYRKGLAALAEHEKRNPLREAVEGEWLDPWPSALDSRRKEVAVEQASTAARCDNPSCQECGGPA